MPLIQSARKKLRQDETRTKSNIRYILAYKHALKSLKRKSGSDALKKVYSAIDKAQKKGIFHKNKANRLKTQASKLVRSFSPKKQVKSK